MTKAELIQSFFETFGPGDKPRVFFAGGRVNLIGEHVDYNGGHVLPCALTMGTWCLLRRRPDDRLQFHSLNFPQLGVLEGRQEPQASSAFRTPTAGSLQRWDRRVRPRLV